MLKMLQCCYCHSSACNNKDTCFGIEASFVGWKYQWVGCWGDIPSFYGDGWGFSTAEIRHWWVGKSYPTARL